MKSLKIVKVKAKVYLVTNQAYIMEPFSRLTVFTKRSMTDVRRYSKYSSEKIEIFKMKLRLGNHCNCYNAQQVRITESRLVYANKFSSISQSYFLTETIK